MRAFRFRLSRVERVREIREEVARGELLLAEQAARAAREAHASSQVELRAAEAALATAQSSPTLTPAAILAAQSTLPGLARRIAVQRVRVEGCERAAEAVRAAWLAARTDVRALQKLEARARQVHQEELLRREDKFIEEIVDRGAGALRSRDAGPGVSR